MAKGRPRRYQGLRITSFYLPIEYLDLLDKLRELAERDGISLSEKIVDAIKEYVEVHYPGNPQTSLDPIIKPDATKPLRLQALFDAKELESVIEKLRSAENSLYRGTLVDKGKKLVLKLSKANIRLNDERIDALIEEFLNLL